MNMIGRAQGHKPVGTAGPKAVASSAKAGGKRLPVLILPGFLSNNTTAATSQYSELKESLLARDHPAADILPANTLDWVPTLSGEHRGALCHVWAT